MAMVADPRFTQRNERQVPRLAALVATLDEDVDLPSAPARSPKEEANECPYHPRIRTPRNTPQNEQPINR
eukprot:957479-Amphidinium_carterae.1